MNIRVRIKTLEDKYHVDIEEFLDLYKRKLSRDEIVKRLDISIHTLRKIGDGLGVVWKKSGRAAWFVQHLIEVNAETDEHQEAIDAPFKENDYLTHKLDVATKALQRSRDEANFLRNTARKTARIDGLEERVLNIVENSIKGLTIESPTFRVSNNITTTEEGLVAVVGDWHIGDTAGEDIPDNTFNYKVAQERIEKFIAAVLNNHQQSTTLTLVNLNDNFKGIIHGGVYTSEGSFIESLQQYIKLYANMLSVFSLIYDKVNVYSTGDNHSRVFEKPVTTNKHLDYSRLMDTVVYSIIESKGFTNVKLHTSDTGYHLVSINGADTLMFHGDTLRTYKISQTISRSKLQDVCMQTFKKPYRHAISGHQHEFQMQTNQFDGMNIVNGSLIGNTSYGFNSGFAAIKASQTVLYIGEAGDIDNIKVVSFT